MDSVQEEEYPCRTKIVNRQEYSIEYFQNGELVMRCSAYGSFETAERFAKKIADNQPGKYSYKIIENKWTEEVCIECGRESWK